MSALDLIGQSGNPSIWNQMTDEEKEWFSGVFSANSSMKEDKINEIMNELGTLHPGIAENMPRIYKLLTEPGWEYPDFPDLPPIGLGPYPNYPDFGPEYPPDFPPPGYPPEFPPPGYPPPDYPYYPGGFDSSEEGFDSPYPPEYPPDFMDVLPPAYRDLDESKEVISVKE